MLRRSFVLSTDVAPNLTQSKHKNSYDIDSRSITRKRTPNFNPLLIKEVPCTDAFVQLKPSISVGLTPMELIQYICHTHVAGNIVADKYHPTGFKSCVLDQLSGT